MKFNSRKISIILTFLMCSFLVACGQSEMKQSFEQAQNETVLLNDVAAVIPFVDLQRDFFYANIGFADSASFLETLQKYIPVQKVQISLQAPIPQVLKPGDVLMVTVSRLSISQNETLIRMLNTVQSNGIQVVAAIFQDFSILKTYENAQFPLLWSSLESDEIKASFAAQVLMGGKESSATLAQDYSVKFHQGVGKKTEKTRLGYSDLNYVGYSNDAFDSFDAIAQEAIAQRAAPGMNVVVVKNGEMVFQKSYGHFKYEPESVTQNAFSLFDLASITKIMATTPYVMKLVEEGKLKLEDTISKFLPELKGSPSQNVTVQEVMLHEAGFIPYIPFYRSLKPEDFSKDSSVNYPTKAAENYYIRKNYFEEVMWPQMTKGPLKTRGTYVYSDVSMYVMRAIIQKITGKDLPEVLNKDFYHPLGLQNTSFNPWRLFPKDRITPTENDVYFRHQLLQGYVHDQGAAMAGGVSGHAGLFSTGNDMAIFYQMLMNKGKYGGKIYLDSNVVNLFTRQFHPQSRRGLGFDKRDNDLTKEYPTKYATEDLYGHTGYTGTAIWISPKNQFIFIFLSNRVYPEVTDKLGDLKTRQRMLDKVYTTFVQKN